MASDAFFPFADGLLTAAEAGAQAIIQPGGSMRDDEVIAAADEAGLAMVFTGMRHSVTKMRRLFQIAILAAGLDYISKMLILNVVQLPLVGRIEVFPPFLNFHMAWNYGVNFGLFAHDSLGRAGC